jgi:hypothetical protein
MVGSCRCSLLVHLSGLAIALLASSRKRHFSATAIQQQWPVQRARESRVVCGDLPWALDRTRLASQCQLWGTKKRNEFEEKITESSSSAHDQVQKEVEAIESIEPERFGDSIDDRESIFDTVSDAEALLACRAYLRRTKRLGDFTAGDDRKRQRRQQLASFQTAASTANSPGFFWEDVNELKYYDPSQSPSLKFSVPPETESSLRDSSKLQNIEGTDYYGLLNDAEDTVDEEPQLYTKKANDDAWGAVVSSRGSIPPSAMPLTTASYSGTASSKSDEHITFWENPSEDSEYDYSDDSFWPSQSGTTSFSGPSSPLIVHQRRSQVALQRFADPEWKAAWYERRWGHVYNATHPNHPHGSPARAAKQQRLLEERMRTYQMDRFMSNANLSAMTEHEIAHAIQTYVQSKQRRGATRRRRRQVLNSASLAVQPRNATFGNSSSMPRDSLYQLNANDLEERRLRRAEIAKRSYQRRLENESQRQSSLSREGNNVGVELGPAIVPRTQPPATPQDALQQIQSFWLQDALIQQLQRSRNVDPWLDLERTVQLALEPARLSHRKEVFHRLLAAMFGLRGKCVPSSSGGNSELQFVTKASIADLGSFVLETIRQRQAYILERSEERTKSVGKTM